MNVFLWAELTLLSPDNGKGQTACSFFKKGGTYMHFLKNSKYIVASTSMGNHAIPLTKIWSTITFM